MTEKTRYDTYNVTNSDYFQLSVLKVKDLSLHN